MPEVLSPDVVDYQRKAKSIAEGNGPISERIILPSKESLPKPLVEIAENIARISGTWNPVEIYTAEPISRDAEKKKFLEAFVRGEEYNPQFTYSYADSLDLSAERVKLNEQMHALRNFGTKQNQRAKSGMSTVFDKVARLFYKDRTHKSKLDRVSRLFRTALYYKIKDDLATCDLVEGIKTKNEKMIARAMRQKYPGTDQAIIEAATSVYNNLLNGSAETLVIPQEGDYPLTKDEQEWLKEKELSPEEFVELIRWGLNEYGMLRTEENPEGFDVVSDKDTTSMDVRDKSKNGPTIYIQEGRTPKLDDALELLTHEIERHARQSKNGEKLFMIGGGKLKTDNEMLYEGYGKAGDEEFRRTFFGDSSGEPLPYFTFAVTAAETGDSFFTVFSKQVDLRLHVATKTPLENSLPSLIPVDVLERAREASWTTTYRVMRGHIDTSNKEKFAMAKDLSYLRGWLIDKQLMNNDLGFLNESGVIASGALQLLAELKIDGDTIPIKNKHIAKKAWETIYRPQMEKDMLQQSSEQALKAA